MTNLFDDLSAIACAAAMIGMTAAFFMHKSENARRRIARLRTAAELLKQHQQSMEQLLDHPRISTKIKSQILSFGDMISDSEVFLAVFGEACERAGPQENRDADAFDRDIAELNGVERGLGEALEKCVSTGLAAMLLMHAEITMPMMAKIYADRETERSLFASASKKSRSDDRELLTPVGLIGAT